MCLTPYKAWEIKQTPKKIESMKIAGRIKKREERALLKDAQNA
jgi:hypothetical protein